MRVKMIAVTALLLVAFAASVLCSADAGLTETQEVYTISTVDEYLTYATYIASGDTAYAAASYRLANSIGFYGVSFVPFGIAENPFKGVFDGCGYCLNDITYSTSRTACGVFGAAENAVIRNLGVVNAGLTATGGSVDAGLLVGLYTGTSADNKGGISRCFASGQLTVNSRKGATVTAGGLIGNIVASGEHSSNCVTDSYANVDVTTKNSTMAIVGGIAGRAGSSRFDGSFTMCHCVSAGTLRVSASSGADVGGLIGFLRNESGWLETGPGASLSGDETNDDEHECFSVCQIEALANITAVSPTIAVSTEPAAKYKLYYGKSFSGDRDDADIAVEDEKIADASFLTSVLGFDFDTVWTLSADGSMPDLRRNAAVLFEDETYYADGLTTLRISANSTRAAMLAAAAYDADGRLIVTVCIPVTKDIAQTLEIPSDSIPASVRLYLLDGVTPLCSHVSAVPAPEEE